MTRNLLSIASMDVKEQGDVAVDEHRAAISSDQLSLRVQSFLCNTDVVMYESMRLIVGYLVMYF